MSAQVSSLAEKAFYLDEFRGKTLLLDLRAADVCSEAERNETVEVLRTLLRNDTKVLLLLETADTVVERHAVKVLCHYLGTRTKISSFSPVVMSPAAPEDELLERIWAVLRAAPLCVGLWPG